MTDEERKIRDEKEAILKQKLEGVIALLNEANDYAKANGLWLDYDPYYAEGTYYVNSWDACEKNGWSHSSLSC